MRKPISYQLFLCFMAIFIASTGVTVGQNPAPATTVVQEAATETMPRRPMKRVPTPTARVTVLPSDVKVAPQVVTIVHRLSGVKMLRLLRRQAGEAGVIETIDPETLMSDAHASIIAGWAMDDGKTIAARLPQAAAEFEVTETLKILPGEKARMATTTAFAFPRAPEPDLTVITNDGRKFRAHLVGLDVETGLSILQLNGIATIASRKESTTTISTGEGILIFAPEPAMTNAPATTRNTYVKIGQLDATVAEVTRSKAGELETLKVRSGKLSPDVVGGVACDQMGTTVGIVESIDGGDATIASADVIRAATRRVLDRRGSVPRPLLGISGEPVEQATWAALVARGWRDEQVKELVKSQGGILLTSVLPQTPAALAKLRPGDVIVRVNQTDVKDAEQFSKLLREAGSGERVDFTVMRPEVSAPFSVPVTLGGSYAPFEMNSWMPRIPSPPFVGFQNFGLQTMALTREVALQMGARNGFLVLTVESGGAGGKAGIREGDVIESIDGRALRGGAFAANPVFARQKKHTLTIVRNREKKQVVVETND
jgi:S1-C subfamily serine protease